MAGKRCIEIDYYKAILCIFVVTGHAITQSIRSNSEFANNIFYCIYIFHMPIFFILSGLIYANYEEKYTKVVILIKKFKRLIVPYITMSLFSYILINLINLIRNIGENKIEYTNIMDLFTGILFSYSNIDKHLWFIYVLFLITSIWILIKPYAIKKIWITIILSAIISIISFQFTESKFQLIARVCYYNFYFQLGYIMFRDVFTIEKVKHIKQSNLCKILLEIIIFCCLNITVFFIRDFPNMKYIKVILFIIISILAFNIIYYYACNLKNIYIKRVMNIVSKYNYVIYLLHNPFITMGTVTIIYDYMKIEKFTAVIIGVIIGIIIPILISKYIINKSKFFKVIITGESYK